MTDPNPQDATTNPGGNQAGSPDGHLATGARLLAEGRAVEAIESLSQAASAEPGNFEAHLLLGRAFHGAGRLPDAIGSFQTALALKPTDPEVYLHLGSVCSRLGALDEAAFMLGHALELRPGMIEAHNNLGLVLCRQKKFDEAETLLRKALIRSPDQPQLHATLGSVLSETGRVRNALAHLEEAVRLDPDYGEAHSNLGNVLRDLGRIEDAFAAYDKAIEMVPDNPHAHVNRGVALLLTGDYGRGWHEYEWRLKTPEARAVADLPPPWQGEALQGKTILVYTEQGVGDVVMFASILPDLVKTGARVILAANPRLVPLLRRSFPEIEVHDLADINPSEAGAGQDHGHGLGPIAEGADHAVSIASLARYFRQAHTDFLAAAPNRYLTPDPAAVELWRKRYAELGDRLTIGISWRGGVTAWDQRLRSTGLDDWGELFAIGGVNWVNLQYGDRDEDIAALEAESGFKLHDWPDAIADLDDFAAQVDALDLVISMSNSTVHFAGALAKPVWTLVPFVPAWRWGLDGDSCPWYPSMRLVRQIEDQPWRDVLSPLADGIKELRDRGAAQEDTPPEAP